MTPEKKKTALLCAILALCLVVLIVLVVLLAQRAAEPSTPVVNQGQPQYIEIPNLDNMPLEKAKALLAELDIQYEIKPTESRIANRVEKIEYKGKTENGKKLMEIDSILTIYANEKGADKVIYLTFDDGPTFSNTFPILDTLDRYGVKATFFVLGNRIVEYSDRIIATQERGHALACHSYSHDLDRSSSGFVYASPSKMLEEISRCEDALIQVLGAQEFDKVAKLFRFPGGSSTNGRIDKAEAREYIADIREIGYRIFDWTALTGDAEGKSTADEFISYMQKGLETAKENGYPIILLMHDKYTTSEALPDILDYLFANGYYFDTLDNCPEYTFAEK